MGQPYLINPSDQSGITMNENQKKVSDDYRSNWDAIFKKEVQPEPSQPIRSTSEGSGDEMGKDEVGAGL